MTKPTTPEWVSDCCGAEAVRLFSERYAKWIYVCKKCVRDCTPVESGRSRKKGESDEI